jgi:hypothetical protein
MLEGNWQNEIRHFYYQNRLSAVWLALTILLHITAIVKLWTAVSSTKCSTTSYIVGTFIEWVSFCFFALGSRRGRLDGDTEMETHLHPSPNHENLAPPSNNNHAKPAKTSDTPPYETPTAIIFFVRSSSTDRNTVWEIPRPNSQLSCCAKPSQTTTFFFLDWIQIWLNTLTDRNSFAPTTSGDYNED